MFIKGDAGIALICFYFFKSTYVSREYIKEQPLNILIWDKGWGGGGGSIQSHPLLTEKTKTPIVVNEYAIKALTCRKSNDGKL